MKKRKVLLGTGIFLILCLIYLFVRPKSGKEKMRVLYKQSSTGDSISVLPNRPVREGGAPPRSNLLPVSPLLPSLPAFTAPASPASPALPSVMTPGPSPVIPFLTNGGEKSNSLITTGNNMLS